MLEHLQEDAFIMELHDAVAALGDLLHGGPQLSVAEDQLGSGLCFSARAAETLPSARAQIAQQHQLHTAAAAAAAEEPRREDARIVDHQAVARAEVRGQVVKMPVLDPSRVLVQNEQARMIAFGDRGLGDQLFGEIKIKIAFFHCFCSALGSFCSAIITKPPGFFNLIS